MIALYVHPNNSNYLQSHLRAVMALDRSRLGLENKSGRMFLVRQEKVYCTKSCQQIWLRVNQPFIIFIHRIWGETGGYKQYYEALFLSYRTQTKCSISQFFKTNWTHSIFRTTEPSKHAWEFSKTVQKFSLLTSAKFAVNVKRVTLQHNEEFIVFIFYLIVL